MAKKPKAPMEGWKKLVLALGGVFVFLALLMWLFEPGMGVDLEADPDGRLSFGDALWFTIVTVTTVGYGDISPDSFIGKMIAVGMFVFSVTVFSFLISKIQDMVAERSRMRELGMDGTRFSGHIVICAWTAIAMVALKELLAAGRRVAVITDNQDDIPIIRELGTKASLFVTVGDVTSEEALTRVNVRIAHTVIAASDDDTHNLIIALEIRRLNPGARVVVSTQRAELKDTLQAQGVTYVASPFELSGRLVASAAFEPEVAKFIEDVTSGADDLDADPEDDAGYDLQQFTLPPTSPMAGQSIGVIVSQFKQMQGPMVVALSKRQPDGSYKIMPNPSENLSVAAHDALVVLGNELENGRAASFLGAEQGG